MQEGRKPCAPAPSHTCPPLQHVSGKIFSASLRLCARTILRRDAEPLSFFSVLKVLIKKVVTVVTKSKSLKSGIK
jgi:hypothetical protein